MRKNKIPVLFIHGDEDRYVPVWMTYSNYEACAAEKELYIVHGAAHALAFLMTEKKAADESEILYNDMKGESNEE